MPVQWALGYPKAFMNPARLVFQEGSCDGNLLITAPYRVGMP
jgi:hypothetical protein